MIEHLNYIGHTGNCALNEEGPCTCGTDEILEELALEEAGLTDEDFALEEAGLTDEDFALEEAGLTDEDFA